VALWRGPPLSTGEHRSAPTSNDECRPRQMRAVNHRPRRTYAIHHAVGWRRSPATLPDFHQGSRPRNKDLRCPADPPAVEEMIALIASLATTRTPIPTFSGRRPGYSPTPIASTGRARSACRVGSARASSASSAETPRIAAS
jgi:hypothetical protein